MTNPFTDLWGIPIPSEAVLTTALRSGIAQSIDGKILPPAGANVAMLAGLLGIVGQLEKEVSQLTGRTLGED